MLKRILNDNISAIDYCPVRMLLEIQFVGEELIYQYFGVPEELWYGLKSSPNMNLYFNAQILGRFKVKKVYYSNRYIVRKSN